MRSLLSFSSLWSCGWRGSFTVTAIRTISPLSLAFSHLITIWPSVCLCLDGCVFGYWPWSVISEFLRSVVECLSLILENSQPLFLQLLLLPSLFPFLPHIQDSHSMQVTLFGIATRLLDVLVLFLTLFFFPLCISVWALWSHFYFCFCVFNF